LKRKKKQSLVSSHERAKHIMWWIINIHIRWKSKTDNVMDHQHIYKNLKERI